MCGLIFEIGMLIFGLIGLISGKLTFSKTIKVVGTPARITGLILVLPLPLALAMGLVLGLLLGNSLSLSDLQTVATIAELLLILVCLGAAYFYANANKIKVIPPSVLPTQPPITPPSQ
jgi:hypothetical protein